MTTSVAQTSKATLHRIFMIDDDFHLNLSVNRIVVLISEGMIATYAHLQVKYILQKDGGPLITYEPSLVWFHRLKGQMCYVP